jgi:hypothetical protein
VRACELLDSLFGEGVHTGAEQRLHLLCGDRVAGVQTGHAGHAGPDPHPGLLAAFV